MGGLGSGQPPKDPEALKAQGTLNKSRERKREKASTENRTLTFPPAPDTMSPGARHHYKYFAELAYGRKILTDSDRSALVELCETYALLLRLRFSLNQVPDEDLILTDKRGRQKEHLLLRQVRALQKDFIALLARFGMTPADAGRVKGITPGADPGDGKPDPWNKLN